MTKYATLTRAIGSPEAQALLAAGLKLVSTDRQLENGTIAFTGRVNKRPVSYKITATGAVLSNDFVARKVTGSYLLDRYRRGLKAANQLLDKRA